MVYQAGRCCAHGGLIVYNYTQDAREAMRVVFFCTHVHKTYLYAQNEISYEYIQILF